MEKRGQFYLLAVVILATLIIGAATISNYVNKATDTGTTLNNARNSLRIESANTVDYGTNQGFNSTQMKTLLTNFTENYINYTMSGSGYFLFGTQSSVRVIAYQTNDTKVYFNGGSGDTLLNITKGETYAADFAPANNTVSIKINEFQYSFNLSLGENYYFVLAQKSNGGTYIVTG